jgi:hypothetical protein
VITIEHDRNHYSVHVTVDTAWSSSFGNRWVLKVCIHPLALLPVAKKILFNASLQQQVQ